MNSTRKVILKIGKDIEIPFTSVQKLIESPTYMKLKRQYTREWILKCINKNGFFSCNTHRVERHKLNEEV